MSATKPALATLMVVALVGCASEPAPKPRKPRKAATEEVSQPVIAVEKAAPVDKSAAVAAELGVEPGDLQWSPGKQTFAVVVPPKDPNDAQGPVIAVYGLGGERQATYSPPTPGAIAELAFLSEDRLIYLVPPRPPAGARGRRSGGKNKPARRAAKTGSAGKGKARARVAGKKASAPAPAPLPTVMYVIQPLQPGAAAIVCVGRRFEFSHKRDHLAWVVGEPGGEYVAADGVQVYPRSGTTTIQGAPAWSRNGESLALVTTSPTPHLVVLVEFDNPNGDNTWPLPPEAVDPSLSVFWAGDGTVVVGPSLTKPVFAASFKRDRK